MTMIIAIIIYAILLIVAIVASFLLPFDTAMCLSLTAAFFTLIATIGIAVLIYYLQRKDEFNKAEKKQRTVKAVMAAELESALDSLILMPDEYSCSFVGGGTRDLFLANATELQEILPGDLFRHLSSVVQFIDSFDNEDDNFEGYHLILRDWIVPLMESRYKEYYPLVFDFHDLLNKRTFELLKVLNSSDEEFKRDLYSIHCTEGNEVFIYDPTDKKYVVDNGLGRFLDGTLNYREDIQSFGIINGYEKSEEFEGQYRNGKPEGYGIRYDDGGQKSDEGTWSEGELIKGTEYNIICKDNGDEPDEVRGSYRQLSVAWTMIDAEIENNGIDKYYVVDRTVLGDKVTEWTNRRSFEEFLSERKPELLKRFKN